MKRKSALKNAITHEEYYKIIIHIIFFFLILIWKNELNFCSFFKFRSPNKLFSHKKLVRQNLMKESFRF